jgi:hypothetical protein
MLLVLESLSPIAFVLNNVKILMGYINMVDEAIDFMGF